MDSLQLAQDVVRCDVCSDPCREKSPAEVHCNTCHTNLCSPCVARHMVSDKAKKHDIVLFHSTDTEIILPTCSVHSKHKCDLFCVACHSPICLKCLSTDHNSHRVQEITELCRSLCKDIEKETEELESHIIPEFEDLVEDEEEKLKKLLQDYDKLEDSIEEHGEQVHKAVDAVINKYKVKVQQMKQDDAKALGQQRDDIKDLLSLAKQTAKRNKLIVRSKNATDMMNYKSENAKLRKIPALKSIIPSAFESKDVSVNLLEKFFGMIPNSRFLFKPEYTLQNNDGQNSAASASESTDKVMHSFALPYKLLYRVACSKMEKLWTCGNENTIKCVDMRNGSILQTLAFSLVPVSFCLTEADILFVCDGVSIVRREGTGVPQSYFSVPGGWVVEAIATTTHPVLGLLAFLRSEDSRQSKTVRIIDAQVRGEFQYDDKGKPLYHSGCYDYFLTENRNGDVCVSDTTALVVIDKSGKFRFKYHGNVFATFDKPFKPRGIATDKDGIILLSDLDNSCIHLVDENGKFLRYITCGRSLNKVCDLCIDYRGQIWIAERNSARVKCIEYH
ncbi:E3 ubiquitin-protein ligase TRIM36-like [Saccostrea echinata]|uniref:E3 ubiquitin-protein ligase TRIM36-like n=1 Tax=Saccostrea echinata TaxID=191078 RepID=UPI002A829063|nr:E3 ubiquitin-protein ligase TRIM36-like [Saccostrea echinata]